MHIALCMRKWAWSQMLVGMLKVGIHFLHAFIHVTSLMKSDLTGLADGKFPQHCQMAIGDIALELLSRDQAQHINALSMASSGICADSDLHLCIFSRTPSLTNLITTPFQHYFR